MPNNSASGGYLAPENVIITPPLEDLALVLVFQAVTVGVTGITGANVRPRWQPNPPNMPAITTDWVAIGITEQEADTFAYVEHSDSVSGGVDILQRNELVTMLLSFYGPNAGKYASLTRDGLAVAQNREVMQLNSIGLVSVESIRAVPALVNNQYYNRLDLPVVVRREILRAYPVLNLLSADGTLTAEEVVRTLVLSLNVQP